MLVLFVQTMKIAIVLISLVVVINADVNSHEECAPYDHMEKCDWQSFKAAGLDHDAILKDFLAQNGSSKLDSKKACCVTADSAKCYNGHRCHKVPGIGEMAERYSRLL